MRLENDPSSLTLPLFWSVVLTGILVVLLFWTMDLRFFDALLLAEQVAMTVSIVASMIVTSWTKHSILKFFPLINWDSYRREPYSVMVESPGLIDGRLYRPMDVPYYGPWYRIVGVGIIIAVASSFSLGRLLEITLWKSLVLSIPVSILIAFFSGYLTFVWANKTYHKIQRHLDDSLLEFESRQ